jgi:long-chain acyl-CoA synthetase
MSATAATVRPFPTIPALVAQGIPKNVSGVQASTKRDGQWIATSPDQYMRLVRQVALAFHDLGVRRGDRVAIHAEPSTEWLIVDLALLSLGAVDVPIYPTQPGDQVAYILGNAGVSVYVTSSAKIWSGVAAHVKGVASVNTLVGIRGALEPGMLGWSDLVARGAAREAADAHLVDEALAATTPDDVATLIYTSGTTGNPKGVTLTHANLTSNALSVLSRLPWDLEKERPDARILSYLPLSHVFERMLVYVYQYLGYPIHFIENVEEIQQDLATVRPVHFSTVPRLLEKVYSGIHARPAQMKGAQKAIFTWALGVAARYDVERAPSVRERVERAVADRLVFGKLRERLGGRLKAITSGGAALSAKVMNFFNAIGVFCGQGYGMTETSPVIAVYDPKHLRAGSIGKPIDGVETRLADDGELLVRGPNVMLGYYDAPEQTADVLTSDGWLKTGDIAERDADGFLFITDRKKDLLKLSTGKYVAPQPIETRLVASPHIEQAVVIGNGVQFCSALIVPASARDDAAQLHALIQQEIDALNRELPHWEQVKKFCLLVRPWTIAGGELTPTLKVKRRVIHERYRATIESMYS